MDLKIGAVSDVSRRRRDGLGRRWGRRRGRRCSLRRDLDSGWSLRFIDCRLVIVGHGMRLVGARLRSIGGRFRFVSDRLRIVGDRMSVVHDRLR